MAILDIFSTSFLFSIAIIIILIGGIFSYVNYRIEQQDHKLKSMVDLFSTMAMETQFFRNKLNSIQQMLSAKDNSDLQYGGSSNIEDQTEELITVSDGGDQDETVLSEADSEHTVYSDEEYDDYDNDDNDEDEDDDDDNEEDNVDIDDDEDEDILKNGMEQIKILNLSLANNCINENINNNDITDLVCDFEPFEEENDEKSINLEQHNELKETEIILSNSQEEEIKNTEDMSFLKSVSITEFEHEDDALISKTDYKKLSLNKLREIIVNKGLVVDASKLKKNEILKMLGDE